MTSFCEQSRSFSNVENFRWEVAGFSPWERFCITRCHPSPYTFLELKAEIEKLKAAQRSRQNIDPERYRLCQQEITSLRMKLHQRERDMAEMQRWGVRGHRERCLAPRDWRAAGPRRTLPLPSRPHVNSAAHADCHTQPQVVSQSTDCLSIPSLLRLDVFNALVLFVFGKSVERKIRTSRKKKTSGNQGVAGTLSLFLSDLDAKDRRQ